MKTQVLQIVRALSLLAAILLILALAQQVSARGDRRRGRQNEQPNSRPDGGRAKNSAHQPASGPPVVGLAPMMQPMPFIYAPAMYPTLGMPIPAYQYADFQNQPNRQPRQQAKNHRKRNRHQKEAKKPLKDEKAEQNLRQPQLTPEQQAEARPADTQTEQQAREDLAKKLAELKPQVLEANERLAEAEETIEKLKQRLTEAEADRCKCERKPSAIPIATDKVADEPEIGGLHVASVKPTPGDASMEMDEQDACVEESVSESPEVQEAQKGAELPEDTRLADESAVPLSGDTENHIDSIAQDGEQLDPSNMQTHDEMGTTGEPDKHETENVSVLDKLTEPKDVHELNEQHDAIANVPVQNVVEAHEDTELNRPISESSVKSTVDPTGSLDGLTESPEKQQTGRESLDQVKDGQGPKSEVASQPESLDGPHVPESSSAASEAAPMNAIPPEVAPGVPEIAQAPVEGPNEPSVISPPTELSPQSATLDEGKMKEFLDEPAESPERQHEDSGFSADGKTFKNDDDSEVKTQAEHLSDFAKASHASGEAEGSIVARDTAEKVTSGVADISPAPTEEAHGHSAMSPSTEHSPQSETPHEVEPKKFLDVPAESPERQQVDSEFSADEKTFRHDGDAEAEHFSGFTEAPRVPEESKSPVSDASLVAGAAHEKQQADLESSDHEQAAKGGLEVAPNTGGQGQSESADVPHVSVGPEATNTAPEVAQMNSMAPELAGEVTSGISGINHGPEVEIHEPSVMLPPTKLSPHPATFDEEKPNRFLDTLAGSLESEQVGVESSDHEQAIKDDLGLVPKVEVEGQSESPDSSHVPEGPEVPIAAPEAAQGAHDGTEANKVGKEKTAESEVSLNEPTGSPANQKADSGYLDRVKALRDRIELKLKMKAEEQSNISAAPHASDEATPSTATPEAQLVTETTPAPAPAETVTPGAQVTPQESETDEPTVVLAPTEHAQQSIPSAAVEPVNPIPGQQGDSFDPISAPSSDEDEDMPAARRLPELTRSQSMSEHRVGSATPSLRRLSSFSSDSRGRPTAPKVSSAAASKNMNPSRRVKKGFRQSLAHGMDVLRQKTKNLEKNPFVHDTIAKIKNHASPHIQSGYQKAQGTMDLLREGASDLRRLGRSAEAPARLAAPERSKLRGSSGAFEEGPTGTRPSDAFTLPYQRALPDRLGAYPLLPRTDGHTGGRMEVNESRESSFSNDGPVKKLRRSMSHSSYFSQRSRSMRH